MSEATIEAGLRGDDGCHINDNPKNDGIWFPVVPSDRSTPCESERDSLNSGSLDFESDDDDTETDETGPHWSEKTCRQRLRGVFQTVAKVMLVLGLLYLFVCSLSFLASAFRLLGGKTAGSVFQDSALLKNPICGLVIGILATVLVQSSSTSTSIVVTMVASGIMTVRPAIPIVMGANIGTSLTNTFVSMAQVGNRKQFKRAFAGATVHDMFNWLTVFVLLPVEVASGYLEKVTGYIVDHSSISSYKGSNQDLLKVITKPLTDLVVKVDKKVIEKIAAGDESYANKAILKTYCSHKDVAGTVNITVQYNATQNATAATGWEVVNVTYKEPLTRCPALFSQFDLSDTQAGTILMVISLILLCGCLIIIVKTLNSMMKGPIAKKLRKYINADLPSIFKPLTGYVAIIAGALMTILVQSSSVFTSTLTPLVGLGFVKLERMYPLTLGSNIGTTMTGILAALAAPGDKLGVALQISLCHLFFNITGIILYFPFPFMRQLPLKAAKFLGAVTAEYRWFAVVYLILMFLLLPLAVFALSMAGFVPNIVVGSLVLAIVLFVVMLKILQSKCPKRLPKCMQTFGFLPAPLRSLAFYDDIISKLLHFVAKIFPCCKCHVKIPADKFSRDLYSVVPQHTPVDTPPSSNDPSPVPSICSSQVALVKSERIPYKNKLNDDYVLEV